MDKIERLLQPTQEALKPYSQLLAEGVQHAGGLALLASAETADPSPSIAALQLPLPSNTSS